MDEKKLDIALGMLDEKELEDLEKLLSRPEVEAIADEERAKAYARKTNDGEPKFHLVH